jgi:hypothetical protein
MQWSTKLSVSVGVAALAIGAMIATSCGPSRGAGHGGNGGTGGGGSGGTGGSGASGGNGGCVNLQCQQMQCAGGGDTTLTGKVFAPNGTLPLYNAIVYIPNSTPAAFTDGVTCDRCNGSVSGDPVSITTTDSSGNFTLTNVPVGANIPLVIQLGKWRRQTTIASVPSCVSTPLDAGTTTLPKNHTEGDIPKMAIVTGSADPFECLLLKMGMDPAEITEPTGTGRISFFAGEHSAGTKISNATPSGTQLYGNMATLMQYDVVMLPCEGGEYDQSNGRDNIGAYVNAGGRVFTTHYSYDWWHYTGSAFDKVGMSWSPELGDNYNDANGIQGLLNTTFPKGMAFAEWLIAAGVTAKSPMGQLNIVQDRHDITGANPMYAQEWITFDYGAAKGGKGVQHMTFNTPLDAQPDDMGVPQYCGRAVYSDFHVAQAEADTSKNFPAACKAGALTDQEKALVFMLFDLSSCVQSDQTNPIP